MKDGSIAPFSNTGNALDLLAPSGPDLGNDSGNSAEDSVCGESFPLEKWGVGGDDFGLFCGWGTSISAPHVTGLAALILSQLGSESVSPEVVEHIIEDMASDSGIINAGAALELAANSTHVRLAPTQDAYLDDNAKYTNYGSADYLRASHWNRERFLFWWYNHYERSVIQFDLSDIPVGATIVSARLNLLCNDQNNSLGITPLKAYRVTASWNENSITYNNGAENYYDDEFLPESVDVKENGRYSWDLTTLTQKWISDSGNYPNYGVMIGGTGSGNKWKQFGSREAAEERQRPYLEIIYTE